MRMEPYKGMDLETIEFDAEDVVVVSEEGPAGTDQPMRNGYEESAD